MKFANVRELKNKTSEILRSAEKEAVIITSKGKPRAIVAAITEEDFEDYLLEKSAGLQAMLSEARAEYHTNSGVKIKGRALAQRDIEKIKGILKDHKEEVMQKYKVLEIGIFGSYVRGEQKEQSDVDILVEFRDKDIPGFIKLSEMERYFQGLLKKKVDLVLKSSIRPELRKGILKEVIYI